MNPERMIEYDLAALKRLFPACDWGCLTVVRCTEETPGEGRWIKAEAGQERRASVRVVCRPAFALSVRLEHQWPAEVSPEECRQLDWGVLEGIMEGLTADEYPALL